MSLESTICEFRVVLMKVANMITAQELSQLQWLFSDRLNTVDRKGSTVTIAIDLFQQLHDRNIIHKHDVSELITALDHVECIRISRILKDYQNEKGQNHQAETQRQTRSIQDSNQSETEPLQPPIVKRPTNPLFDHIYDDNKDSLPMDQHEIEPAVNLRNEFFLDSFDNPTASLKICEKTIWKNLFKKYFIFSLAFLLYTILLVVVTYFSMVIYQNFKTYSGNSQFSCHPKPGERYLIRSVANEYLIGLNTLSRKQQHKNLESNDNSNQLCQEQWYFHSIAQKKNTFGIESAYHKNVFMISNGKYLDMSQTLNESTKITNTSYQFRLIHSSNSESCQIQSLITNNIFDVGSEQFIDQTHSTINRIQTQWQLIPFGKNNKPVECPSMQSINDVSIIKFGKVHGEVDGGFLSDDSRDVPLTISSYISSIWINASNNELHSIKFCYSTTNSNDKQQTKASSCSNSNSVNKGQLNSTNFNVIQINPNERIQKIELRLQSVTDSVKIRSVICGIRFHTTFNRSSAVYGNPNGESLIEEYSGFFVGYMRTAKRKSVGKIQFVWYKT